jgi:RimJ/RimL family protein N-acetyltransferase
VEPLNQAMTSVELRPVTLSDRDLLLKWRNDFVTVRFSGTARAVTAQEHDRWFARRLAMADPCIWIGVWRRNEVGQVRLDQTNDRFAVDVAVAPEWRGRGFGTALLCALTTLAGAEGRVPLIACVHLDNNASLRSFASAGFREIERDDEWVQLRWPAE